MAEIKLKVIGAAGDTLSVSRAWELSWDVNTVT